MAIPVIRYCKVKSVNDDTGRDLIQVYTDPDGNGVNSIMTAAPLLPKLFHIKPKVNEGVFVLLADASDTNSLAYYIGPVISQEHKIPMQSFDSNSLFRGNEERADVNPKNEKDLTELIPGDNEIWVRGRRNGEIQITDDDVRLRAGVKVTTEGKNDFGMIFNQSNPAFAKFRYHMSPLKGNVKSTASILADKIILMGNDNRDFRIDGENLITDEDLEKIINEAEKIPYGKKLVKLLKVMIEAFIKHTHPYIQMPPVLEDTITKLNLEKANLLDNEKLLSDNIRIN